MMGNQRIFGRFSTIDEIQIHSDIQTKNFFLSNGNIIVATTRIERASINGDWYWCADTTLYDPDKDSVLILIGLVRLTSSTIAYPSIARHAPVEILNSLEQALSSLASSTDSPKNPLLTFSVGYQLVSPRDIDRGHAIIGLTSYLTVVHHIKRYLFAARILKAGSVLDCACGSGYGKSIMLQNSHITKYVGVDADENICRLAEASMADERGYIVNSRLEKYGEDNFDNVVSLETIEHAEDPHRFLALLSGKMAPDGQIILSLPVLPYYAGTRMNPHHLTNWTYDRAVRLVERFFERHEVMRQDLSLKGPETFSASSITQSPLPLTRSEYVIIVASIPKRPPQRRVVVRRRQALGDVVWCEPILHAAKGEFPDCPLVIATDYPELFYYHPLVEVVATASFPKCKEDIVIDLDFAYERRRHLHLLEAYASAAQLTVTKTRPQIYLSSLECRSVLNILAAKGWPKFGIDKIVVLHLAATSPHRIWPVENWQTIIERLLKIPGVGVVIAGHKRDLEPRTDSLGPVLAQRILSVVRKLSIIETAALLGLSDLFIGPDSGLCHIAAGVGVPSVQMFGMAAPETRLPLDGSGIGVWSQAPCRGCLQDMPPEALPLCKLGDGRCYKQISLEDVWRVCLAVLNQASARTWLRKYRLIMDGLPADH